MKWYLAKMIYRIISGMGDHRPQFDEQLRLIAAGNHREAFEKARRLGEKGQHRFLNIRQQYVHWRFVEVTELLEVEAPADGAELYYQLQEPGNAEEYLELVHQKAAQVADRLTSGPQENDIALSA